MMAERRMFAKTIVLSDAFLDMPLSARCLYFTLSMLADDDGFVNAPKSIMRQCGASNDDMKILLSKKFVLLFESGVLVIKHWRINNYLQKDRIQPTKYQEEFGRLEVGKNGAYSLNNDNEYVENSNNVYIEDVYTDKNSIDEIRLDKDSINTISCSPEANDCTKNPDEVESQNSKNPKKKESEAQFVKDFEIIYGIYPKKRGRTKAFAAYKLWVTKGKEVNGKRYKLTNRQIYKAVQKYVDQQERSGQDDYQYWKNFDTLMGAQLLDYVTWEE